MHFSTTLLTLSVTLSGVYGAAIRRDVCYEDNTLRALQRYSTQAAAFCPKFLAGSDSTLPDWVGKEDPSNVSSACKCFDKTASQVSASTTAPSTTAPATTATTSTAAPVTTQDLSTSTTASASAPSSVVPSSTTSSTATAPASTSPSTPSSGSDASSTKRGLVYDYNSKTSYGDLFKGSKYVTWGSNWQAQRAIGSVTLDSSFSFVPTLGVDSSLKNTNWINTVTNLISTGGVTKLFASNEPDNAGQANLKAADAATVYKAYMQPFAGKAKLATPAVTNGGGSAGLNYMSDFLNACNGCTFDFINVHHYLQRTDVNVDQAVSALKSYLLNDVPKFQAAHPQLKDAKIVVGEVCFSLPKTLKTLKLHTNTPLHSSGSGAPPPPNPPPTSKP